MRRKAGSQSGFTLIEVIIALSLSALLLGVLTAGMRTVVDQWQDSSSPFEDQLDTSLVFLQVEQALLGATPHGYVDQDTLERNVYFQGSSDSIAWVSTISPQTRQRMTAWQLTVGELDGVILKSTAAFVDDPTERLENATGTLILPDMRLDLAYLLVDEFDRPEWLDEWDGVEYQLLPLAVRLEFTASDQSEDREMEFIVPFLQRQHEAIEPVDTE